MAEPHRVAALARELFARHLPDTEWAFGFDTAKRRAGACNYTKHRITVSRYLSSMSSIDDVEQTLLHEIAHALAGHNAAHGPRWKAIAASIGYTGSRLHNGPIASEHANWIGECPAGHVHYRFRRPTRPMSCGRCSSRFSREALITWRTPSVADLIRERQASSTS